MGDHERPVAVTLDGDTLTCRTIVPDARWADSRRREAIWDGLRGECEAEAVRQAVTFAGSPERASQYIRFFTEDGHLKCDTGATEWTATDVWLQLTVKVER